MQVCAYLPALGVHLVDGLDSVQVIDTRVQTNLVEHCNTGILGLLVKRHHGFGDIRGGNDMLLLVYRGLDHLSMESVRDERDDKSVLGDLSLESLLIRDVQGDGCGVLEAFGKLLGAFKSSAGEG